MTKEEAYDFIANYESEMFNNIHPTCAGVEVIDKIYDDFENQKCTNCKYFHIKFSTFIHCNYFDQSLPIEIGKCDMWESKDE